jgi:two-component system, LuxR family, response regulator FixJ
MTIALIDDDEAVLRSLQLLLRNRGIEVHCFGSAEDFLAGLERRSFRCIVCDVRMPGLTGLDLQQELKRRRNITPLILITGHGDIAMAVRAIKEGALDFIEKPFDDERLVASIAAAEEKGQQQAVGDTYRAELQARFAELSPRERQVMALVAEGLANKEIALRLEISPRTVESYRAWVMEKMGASNLADLVRKAMMLDAFPNM